MTPVAATTAASEPPTTTASKTARARIVCLNSVSFDCISTTPLTDDDAGAGDDSGERASDHDREQNRPRAERLPDLCELRLHLSPLARIRLTHQSAERRAGFPPMRGDG